jgi:hypothetical protein
MKLEWIDCSTHKNPTVEVSDEVTLYGATLPKGMKSEAAAKDYAQSYDFNREIGVYSHMMPTMVCKLTDNRSGKTYTFSFQEHGKNFRWNV